MIVENAAGVVKTVNLFSEYVFDNEQPIIILGPDGTNEDSYRVYAYGGLLGTIDTNGNFSKSVYLTKDYKKHLAPHTVYIRKSKEDIRKNDLQYLKRKYPEVKNFDEQFENLDMPETEKLFESKMWLDLALCAMKNWGRKRDKKTKI